MLKKLLYIALIIVITLIGWGRLKTMSAYENISVEEAKELMDTQEVVIIDVREPREYAQGHIPGSILIPLEDVPERWQELDKEATIIMVCRSGNRSANASNILVEQGFKDVKNMRGGMIEWPYEIE